MTVERIKYNTSRLCTDMPYNETSLKRVILNGLWLRVAILLLIIVLFYGFHVSPHYITDDSYFDSLSMIYRETSRSFIDVNVFNGPSINLARQNSAFWIVISSLCTKLSGDIWLTRVVNIVFSLITIKLLYMLCEMLYDKKTALLAAKLYAYLPYPIFVSCFPVKDVELTLACVGFLYFGISLMMTGKKSKLWSVLLLIFCSVAIYYTRNSALYVLSVVLIIYIIICTSYGALSKLMFIILCIILVAINGAEIIDNLTSKVDSYIEYERSESVLSLLRVDSIRDIYKLPLAYWFSMFQPIAFGISNSFWRTAISIANYSLIPISVGNIFYLVFYRKRQPWFYWSMLFVYCGVIVLSLSIFRHYYFMMFFTLINFSLFRQGQTYSSQRQIYIISSCVSVIVIFMYALIKNVL